MDLKEVKFITNQSSKELNNYLIGLTPNKKGLFGNYKFYFNADTKQYDYLVVFEFLPDEIILCDNAISIFIVGESTSIKNYNQNFLDQFDHIITCQKRIKHKSVFYNSPGHTWFSDKTYDELLNTTYVKKEKLLSIVVSNKVLTKGHRDRLDFCLKLKEKLGDKVDLFGRGFKDFEDKWNVIAPYKYSIAIENSIEDDWVTEKIGDCYTSHTFPFYMGAPNISKYYNTNSYELIDITNFEDSFSKIISILNDNSHYEKHLNYLIDAKLDYINKHSMIPMVCNFIDNLKFTNKKQVNKVILPHKNNILQKIINIIMKYFKRFI